MANIDLKYEIAFWACLINSTIWQASTDEHALAWGAVWLVMAVVIWITQKTAHYTAAKERS